MAEDPIEAQLKERLAYIERYPDDIEQSLSLARECAALRHLVADMDEHCECGLFEDLMKRIEAAKNGEEVRE